MKSTYSARKAIHRDGLDHFAEITVRASPGEPPTQVTISAAALDDLKSAFGEDFEYQRHNVHAAVAVQISTVNIAGEMPHTGSTSFQAEVLQVRVSGNAGREVSGFLLSVAGMDAIAEYLCDWEDLQQTRAAG